MVIDKFIGLGEHKFCLTKGRAHTMTWLEKKLAEFECLVSWINRKTYKNQSREKQIVKKQTLKMLKILKIIDQLKSTQ